MANHLWRQSLLNWLPASSLLFLLPCVGHATPQGQLGNVVIRVRVLPQEAPVRILGIKFSRSPDPSPLVQLQNTSRVKTRRLWIETIISNAQGKVTGSETNAPNYYSPAEHSIAPGAEVWSKEPVLRYGSYLESAKHLGSNCVLVGVRVLGVDFEDGTSWRASTPLPLPPRDTDWASACRGATASGNEVRGLEGARYVSTGLPPKIPGEVQSYTLTCSLEASGRDIVGFCPL